MSSSEVKNKIAGSKNYGKINASLLPIEGGVVLSDGTLYADGKIDVPKKAFDNVQELEGVEAGFESPYDFNTLPESNFDNGQPNLKNIVQCSIGTIGRKGVKKCLFDLHIEGSFHLGESETLADPSDQLTNAKSRRVDFFIVIAQNNGNINASATKTVHIPFSQLAEEQGAIYLTQPVAFAFDCQIEWTASNVTPVEDGDDFVCRLYYRVPKQVAILPATFFGIPSTDIPEAATGVLVHNGVLTTAQSGSGATYQFPPSQVEWTVQGSAKIIETL